MLARVGRSDLQHSLHASPPTGRTRRTSHLLPPLFTHWTMIGRSTAHIGRNRLTGTREGSAQVMFCSKSFYSRMPFLPPTHQMMSAVVGLPNPVLRHSQDFYAICRVKWPLITHEYHNYHNVSDLHCIATLWNYLRKCTLLLNTSTNTVVNRYNIIHPLIP